MATAIGLGSLLAMIALVRVGSAEDPSRAFGQATPMLLIPLLAGLGLGKMAGRQAGLIGFSAAALLMLVAMIVAAAATLEDAPAQTLGRQERPVGQAQSEYDATLTEGDGVQVDAGQFNVAERGRSPHLVA